MIIDTVIRQVMLDIMPTPRLHAKLYSRMAYLSGSPLDTNVAVRQGELLGDGFIRCPFLVTTQVYSLSPSASFSSVKGSPALRVSAPKTHGEKIKSVANSLLIMLYLAAATLSSPIVHAASSPEIRLPGLIHRWKLPDEGEKPPITLDEISRCIGTDIGVRERQEAIKEQEATLESEYAEIAAQLPSLEKQAADLKSSNDRIEALVVGLDSESARLKVRRNAIESNKKIKRLNPAEIRQLNSNIASYNEDVQTNNRQRSLLKSMATELQAKIDTYNGTLGKHNERINVFNDKSAIFKTSVSHFNTELLAYQNQCAGERTLKK